MKRICLVVQRYGADIVGGSEQLARCYAGMLQSDFEVHVATTCAADHSTWRNVFPAGTSSGDGVTVHRFLVDHERDRLFHELHYQLLIRHVFDGREGLHPADSWTQRWAGNAGAHRRVREAAVALSASDQLNFVRSQGPYSSALLFFLESARENYDLVIFFTYLYSPTCEGFQLVPGNKRILVPTLHDEPAAYLPLYGKLMKSFDYVIYLSPGEKAFAERLFGPVRTGWVVGMPVQRCEAHHDEEVVPDFPYILYCGRIESAKGCTALIENFIRYKRQTQNQLKLVLAGHAVDRIPSHPDIVFLGYVSETRKFQLMKNAIAFVNGSPFESFSIVLLEAFSSGCPGLVYAGNDVLREHCRSSNGGLFYEDYFEFAQALHLFLQESTLRGQLGSNAMRYVEREYSKESVRQKLLGCVHEIILAVQVKEAQGAPARGKLS